MNDNKEEKIEYLYFIKVKTNFGKKDKHGYFLKEHKLVKVPIITETRLSYYVPKFSGYKTLNEFMDRFKNDEKEVLKNCYLVNKKTMMAKISNYGVTHERYYQHPFLAKESFFVNQNAYKISEKLKGCKNPYLLRQIAHNLEMKSEELIELEYEE